jgi:glycosyltransferase involved in cell wall biosynthesis
MLGGVTPYISLVIPAFNEASRLPEIIQQARGALRAAFPGKEVQVVVCDNNSTDGTGEAARLSGAEVVFEPHNQIARARNTGARAARGEWLVFLDADTVLPAALAVEMAERLADERVGGGGAVVRFDTARLRWGPALVLALWNTISRAGRLAAGSFIFCRRTDWEAVGGFDERFYAAEELDFSRRLKRHLSGKGQRFTICRTPVLTSARKLEWNNDLQLLRLIPLALRPSRWRSREACAFWYVRPEGRSE